MSKVDLASQRHQPLEVWRMEARARRAARLVSWVARKTQWRAGTVDNHGGFALVDPFDNTILYGERFDLSAEDVIALTQADTASGAVPRKQGAVSTKHSWSDKEAV